MPAGQADYIAIVEEPKPQKNRIDKPESFVFDDDQSAKYGQLVTIRVKADKGNENKLCVTEIEGIPLDYDKDNDGDSAENDYDKDGE